MRWILAPLLAMSWLTGPEITARAAEPEIWFDPHQPADMMDMWTDDAPWQHAASKVRYLELIHWWIRQATDQQILEIADFASRHHMKLVLQTEPILIAPPYPCGGGMEGYTTAPELPQTVATLQRLGVQIDRMTMDGPLWFGHYLNSTNSSACNFAPADLATNVAGNISSIIAAYPNIQITEIEPIPGVTNFADWQESETTFQRTLAQATGRPIRSMQLDMDTSNPTWTQAVQKIRAFTKVNGEGMGVIYNGTGMATSDATWIGEALQNIETLEGRMGIIPDHVMFATWYPYPAYNMPETSPTAQTWLIDHYFKHRTLLQAQFLGQGAHGKLTDDRGRPIANATINGYVPGVDFSQPLPTKVVQGVVPATAANLLIGIRLNSECNCQGLNDVLLGPMQYQESQGGTRSQTVFLGTGPTNDPNQGIVTGELVDGVQVTRLIVEPTQSVLGNVAFFPVTGGATFQYTIPASTIGGSGWFGHILGIWFDANNNSVGYFMVIPDTGRRLMSTATTAVDGTFQLSTLPRVGPGAQPVTVEFAGDDDHRSSVWSPVQ